MAIDPKLLDIEIKTITIKLSDKFSEIFKTIQTIKLYDDSANNTNGPTFGVFFDTDGLFKIPNIIDDVEKCKTTVRDILSELNSQAEKVITFIENTIDNKDMQTQNWKVISNFNEIKTVFSRLYVCILVYERKKESATSDINEKINKLKEFLRDTTEFLLNLDDVKIINDNEQTTLTSTKWPSLQTDGKTNVD
jgi:hypothetical protein